MWFRLDLRVADNPALRAASEAGAPILPVYVMDESAQDGPLGRAGCWWLHHSLETLARKLEALGAPLVLLRGKGERAIAELAQSVDARAVFWNRRYEPEAIARDKALKAALIGMGLTVSTFNASLLFEPWTVKTRAGAWFKVFTPFWKACLGRPAPDRPLAAPDRLNGFRAAPAGDKLTNWHLLPHKPNWASGFGYVWQPGEGGALERIDGFLDETLTAYGASRDNPATEGTSRLSPHLRWGEIGPRQIWHAVMARMQGTQETAAEESARRYIAELGWREFSYHLLYHFPDLPDRNFRDGFDAFPWREPDDAFEAWKRGMTGYPIVDAGMRELWSTGWMHNRVRMVAASFLVKDLLIDWRLGKQWFEDTLVDADLASNSASWQWVAGSGADAAPYFRIFNPSLQGERFDPEGAYVRRWIPELAGVPSRWIHRPWEAPEQVRADAGVHLGPDYPVPCVDHAVARRTALQAFERLKAA